MRRVAVLALVAGGTLAVGTLAWYRLKETPKVVSGIFSNGMAYARLGRGPKNLLWIRTGPGNVVPPVACSRRCRVLARPVPRGRVLRLVRDAEAGHADRVHRGGHAEDYARLIADEFDGKVDLVIGRKPPAA